MSIHFIRRLTMRALPAALAVGLLVLGAVAIMPAASAQSPGPSLVVAPTPSPTPSPRPVLVAPATRGPAAGVVQTPPPARTPAQRGPSGLLGPGCPEGTVLVIFDQPVYDANGLFVIGYTPVPYCVPEDLEPAG